MKIAYSTLATPGWSWAQILERGTAYGFQGVEIRLLENETNLLVREEFQAGALAKRREELAACGFCVCGLASNVRFDAPEPAARAEQVQIGKAYIDLACELGARFVRIFGDKLPGGDDAARTEVIANVAAGLNELGRYAEPAGIRVVIETHGDFADSHVVQRCLRQVQSPAAGVLWDTHHPWRYYGEPVAETFERIGQWVMHTHWKDSIVRPEPAQDGPQSEAAATAHALMSGHRHADYVLFGGGEFPALETMRLLHSAGYDGWFSLEWEKAWHPEIEDPEVALPLFPGKLRFLAESARGAK